MAATDEFLAHLVSAIDRRPTPWSYPAFESIGTFFYPTVRLVDLRFAKSVPVGKGKLEGLFDIFNLTNSPAVLSVNTQTGASFGNVLTTVNPRIVRLGARWSI